MVIRMNQADYVVLVEFLECILEGSTATLGSVAFAPKLTAQGPADLKCRPALRIRETDSSCKITSCFFFDSPITVAKQVPVTDKESHMSPRLGPIEDVTPEVTHDFRVGAHLRIWLEVAFAPHAK